MAVQTMKPQPSGLSGLMSSPLTKVTIGALTGGVGGAALGLASSKNSGIGEAANAVGGASNAFGRRQEALSEPTPEDHINAAIDALPAVMETHPEIAHMAAPALYGARHFGGPHQSIDDYYENMGVG